MQPLVVTLDGPAGSGKSTVARTLAQRLGLEFLDTGAMYRGLTAQMLDRGLRVNDYTAVARLAQNSQLFFDWDTDPPRLHIHDLLSGAERDVTDRLRDPDVTANVSELSTIAEVRRVLVEAQRRIGQEHPCLVTEGRDQGSVVFPHAPVKFYVDASAQVRAHRRADQLRAAGKPADEAEILRAILERDQRDSSRPLDPLIRPP